MSRELDELLHPEVDWREQMKEFVKNICAGKDASSWRRVNRRYLSGDVYMPTLISEKIGRIVIGADTSGSIGNAALTKFLSEVKGIADDVKPEYVDLMYWDDGVAQHEVYDSTTMPNIVSSTKPKGGGGTDPRCVISYMREQGIKPECVVMLTDGYIGEGEWGDDWEVPVLWAVLGNARTTAPIGKTIHIKDV
jgi:predicted metal-dependent peptidase